MHPGTFTQTAETRAHTLERLDNEIQTLINQLHALKAHRNTISITYILPAEVLSEIFAVVQAHCKSMKKPKFDCSESPFWRFKRWIRVTQVSQHWRKVAFESSQLWCELDKVPAAAIPLFLSRSAGRNLTVNLPIDGRQDAPPAIFEQINRIQKLVISSGEVFRTMLSHIGDQPMFKLKRLAIRGLDMNSNKVDIPDDLFQGHTPELERVYLDSCNLSPNSRLFTENLTRLTVVQCLFGQPVAWLDILQRLPRLSHLTLKSAYLFPPTLISKEVTTVALHNLSVLELQGLSFDVDLNFLSHLVLPSTAPERSHPFRNFMHEAAVVAVRALFA